MTKYFSNNFAVINLHKKPSKKSEIVTQMIFGDSFIVSKKTKKWLKVRIKEDGYKGYVQNKNFSQFFKPTHKINVLKAKVYKFPNQREKVNEVSFGSKIKVLEKRLKFYKFSKGWIKKNDVRPMSYKENDPFKKITIYKNIKYKWGGKSFKGIDCSALIH